MYQPQKSDSLHLELLNFLFDLKKLNSDGESMVKKMKQKYENEYSKYKSKITSSLKDLNIDEEI